MATLGSLREGAGGYRARSCPNRSISSLNSSTSTVSVRVILMTWGSSSVCSAMASSRRGIRLCPNSQISLSMLAFMVDNSSTARSAPGSTRTARQRNVQRALSSHNLG